MATHNDIGQWGEDLAAQFLIHKGYDLLERNWRFSRAEVDIIAMQGDVLVIVEVKSRTSNFFGQPEESVDHKKIRMLSSAAGAYMKQIQHEWEVRFDIISVLINPDKEPVITHIEDAFFMGLDF